MDTAELIRSVPTDLFLGGRWIPAEGGNTFAVRDPATGDELTRVADASPGDAAAALDAAVAAGPDWAATPPRQRGEILRSAFEKVTARADDFAHLMSLEMGKALPESRSEVAYGAEFLRWFSEEAVRIPGRYTQAPAGTGRILVTKQPVGPCLAITPWNFPLAMGTRKIGPAFAAGCTMLVKPASETPLTLLLLAEIFAEAGLPEGVLSVLPTSHASAVTGPLLEDTRLRKLTFTGSTGVGRALAETAGRSLLRTSLELGGNAPFLVFDDADLDAAVEGAVAAKLRNGGEACTAANRFHVANSVKEEFVTKLAERMSAYRMGPGTHPDTTLGPLINEAQRNTVVELVDDAISAGARIRLGGQVPDGPGWFYPATVIDDVPQRARILREEVFGPVAAISGFDTEDEAIAAANATEYGLAAYVFTNDLDRALRLSDAIESGILGVNRGVVSDVAAPFGGVKDSGLGREGGSEGIEEYLDTKYIALQ
ncbi:NAD-dependent succinate-semialdehyde dehydrogenase [Rhodococcus sp. HNM0563]|uniref:NAD-dependent succinate-semialdehyde dehydrogenase n=1 Tax=unclassified Rhodococcus (in: high G+C Gram-positive bacteria) TaxID=192944 RepID=UPI00146C3D54|nr:MULTISPECIES: NAD-dependent succinate-semialdehyde dehydrogenase [unclassified Rhodococcus (in: high G+C Gram-positive bacteria)]MCK0089561.1 NAD-dependent succinate-semialdehyde dehydrogenase [Rhodococcus sp. F64268]NLU62502.1 NAD-dependent succinate-semialdehyde dehydrogenase [Rhodococcus sp. HNM0563]